ncbi:hypothetical protein [Pedobacter nyackensis]|uniref:Uncharacterized protein n=1 Tax=Pedobacter nyackensis TaxID=475255 RepID=A0A1W2CQD1_9SPHI|nr:hypothetical protein [Pedobacter nyackensis]SMC87082.1 hypothetical protein SAMN04488101_10476 [Pedobacter nyackensis]
MKRHSEEEVQKLLFTALSTPSEEGLSMDFSTKLRNKLQEKLQYKNRLRFYGGWALIFVVAITILFFGLLLLDSAYDTHITNSIGEHKWLFIITFPLLFLIQYLDHITIKKNRFKEINPGKNK